MRRKGGSFLRVAGVVLGVALLIASAGFVARTVDAGVLRRVVSALLADPAGLALALLAYAGAFGLRTWAWQRTLPGLPAGQAWAALHVSLLGNHVLPLRLGEALRVASVARRTTLPLGPVTASALTLRAADVLAVLGLAAVAAPTVMTGFGPVAILVTALALGGALGGLTWIRRLRAAGSSVRLPGAGPLAATTLAWLLEAAVVWEVARVAGIHLTGWQAVVVTAATIAAQAVAVTPGGFGTYEAAATAAMVAIGVPAGAAFAVAVTTHAVKTGYALVVGAYALIRPAPGYWGRFRLPRRRPSRPLRWTTGSDAPVVVIVPVHDEEATVADVVRRLPRTVQGRRVVTLVVDDGSTDRSSQRARQAGAVVVTQPRNLGLGAAVRRGLAEATALDPAAVVYLDADLEYDPAQAGRLAAPVLDGSADYVVGSRFAGDIRRMLPHRRLGNVVLTRWVRWMVRLPVTDGQSGYRAFSPRAAAEAEIIHDYNYAQVLTLNLVGRGFVYREVPISYEFRASGSSFVRLGRYLRTVLPAVLRELNRSADSVLDDVAVEPLAGRRPRVAVEPAVVTQRVDGVVGHDQGVVGVVVGEQALPAERHHPPQHPGPRVDTGQVVLEADPVHGVDLPEPAGLHVQAVHRG
ncbi:MAG TPA: lysylphosphatidylglycerol synthase domain-containing protein [Jiangellaceae bacterium]|nr:lysylphosphatidylglycerol synthase domain-containing protein [Jiangellaceae bacterium]